MTEVTAFQVASSRKPSNGKTHIQIILDETGSMGPVRDVTIASFNEFIDNQKLNGDDATVGFVTFSSNGTPQFGVGARLRSVNTTKITASVANHTSNNVSSYDDSIRSIFEAKKITEVEKLSNDSYSPRGWTNLYDAIGVSVQRIDDELEGLESVPDVLVVIITDGQDNSSSQFDAASIKELISQHEAKYGWTFVYLGANQDAWTVGQSLGLASGQCMSFNASDMGHTVQTLNACAASYREERRSGVVGAKSVSRGFFNPKSTS